MDILRTANCDFRAIVEQLLDKLAVGGTEYLDFPGFIEEDQHNYIYNIASSKNMYVRALRNPTRLRVYKNNSNRVLEETPICMLENSMKMLYSFLMEDNTESDFGPPDDVNRSLHKFSIGFANNCMSVPNLKICQKSEEVCRTIHPIFNYKEEILQSLELNRSLIVLGESGSGKSTQLPRYILEDCALRGIPCKMLSVQINNFAAIMYRDSLVEQLGEDAVGYQIHIEGRSSGTTALIFTTYNFFLRWLVGLKSSDAFTSITHIILDDFHNFPAILNLILLQLLSIMEIYTHLKLILIGFTLNTTRLEQYLPQSVVVTINNDKRKASELYLGDILTMTQYKTTRMNEFLSQGFVPKPSEGFCQSYVDRLIGNCFLQGDNESFNTLLYEIESGYLPIDVCHSELKVTPLIAAACHQRTELVKKLIKYKANPFLVDSNQKSAFDWANEFNSSICSMYLQKAVCDKFFRNESTETKLVAAYEESRGNDKSLDTDLVLHTIWYVHMNFPLGTLLVFLPDINSVLKIKALIEQKVKANDLNVNFFVFTILENTTHSDCKRIRECQAINYRKIILTTDLVQATVNIPNVAYIIDSGRKYIEIYDPVTDTYQCSLDYINFNEACQRYALAASNGDDQRSCCFRLYSREKYKNFNLEEKPEVERTPLALFCLFAKLLADTDLFLYLNRCLQNIPQHSIERSIDELKYIGALDDYGSVTILGLRLIDIPIDVKLGKTLIFGVLFRCLDPIVTIVSAMACQDPWCDPLNYKEAKKIEGSRKSFSEDLYSDHLTLLRVYQKWQKQKPTNASNKFCTENYLLDGTLQAISKLRVQLIGNLRVAGLVHTNGILSMQTINQNSDDWVIVKAALTAGLYPNVYYIDKETGFLKNLEGRVAYLSWKSVLKSDNRENDNAISLNYPSNWIISYGKQSLGNFHVLHYNTLVTASSVALFSGGFMVDKSNPIASSLCNSNRNSSILSQIPFLYSVDEKASFLLMKTRDSLNKFVVFILQHCANQDRFRKCQLSMEKSTFITILQQVLKNEESALNLPDPLKIGEKPKALPENFVSQFAQDFYENMSPFFRENTMTNIFSKNFYLLCKRINDSEEIWFRSMLTKVQEFIAQGCHIIALEHDMEVLRFASKFNEKSGKFEKFLDFEISLHQLRTNIPHAVINTRLDWHLIDEEFAKQIIDMASNSPQHFKLSREAFSTRDFLH